MHPIASLKPRSAGFTLVELMVVVVIASTLMAIAIPSYIDKVRKSRRTEAKTALLDLAGREERFFNTNNTYTATPSDLGYGTGAAPLSMNVGNGYYKVTVAFTPPVPATNSPGTYLITAVPITTDQLKDTPCLVFTLNNLGQQTPAPPSTCWQ